jgi:hypothetical protein
MLRRWGYRQYHGAGGRPGGWQITARLHDAGVTTLLIRGFNPLQELSITVMSWSRWCVLRWHAAHASRYR